jgi:hypothetical protein
MGFMFLNTGSNPSVLGAEIARKNGIVAGIVCLALSSGVFLFALRQSMKRTGD